MVGEGENAVYVVGNVIALLIFGRLSDQIGRRRVAIPAVGLAAAGTLLFLLARGVAWLVMARVLSGLAVGCAAGTATAWVADLLGPAQRLRASVFASSANFAGIAIGPLIVRERRRPGWTIPAKQVERPGGHV
jgi:MFS family permease